MISHFQPKKQETSGSRGTAGWKSRRRHILAKEIEHLIGQFIANEAGAAVEQPPYVEVDYPKKNAVFIRRLTNLPKDLVSKLTSQADQVYKKVMNVQSEIS